MLRITMYGHKLPSYGPDDRISQSKDVADIEQDSMLGTI